MTVATKNSLEVEGILDAAFKEVIEMMFGLVVNGPLDPPQGLKLSVAGMIGLAGPEFHGLLQISCTETGARKLAAALLGGEEMLDDPSMITDSLGELANMLGGAVKQRVDTSGVKVEISLPSVLEGQFDVHEVGEVERLNLHFVVDDEVVRAGLTFNTCEGGAA